MAPMSTYRALVEAEIDTFLSEAVVASRDARIRSTDLYAAFARWWDGREDEHLHHLRFAPPPPSQRMFTFVARERIAYKRTADANIFLGVKLVE